MATTSLHHTVPTEGLEPLLQSAQPWRAGVLYVLATPIGNPLDMTLRGVQALRRADLIACEDTRKTAALMTALSLPKKPLLRADAHREVQAAAEVIAHLARGDMVVFCSDAGTPVVNDPGARLVTQVRAAGHGVVPLPGASCITTLLSVCGVDLPRVSLLGFAPVKTQARRRWLQTQLDRREPFVLLEAPHRLRECLQDLQQLDPTLHVVLGKELTKPYECVLAAPPAEVLVWLEADPKRCQGEFVLLVVPGEQATADVLSEQALHVLRTLAEALPASQAAALAAKLTGVPRQALFQALRHDAPVLD